MINKKEYKTPLAEITEFECADIITISELSKSPKSAVPGSVDYVPVGQTPWGDGLKKQ